MLKNEFTIKNLSFAYDNNKTLILENINVDFFENEFVCVLGKSGCGKSTMLRLLAGLETPTVGEIIFENNKINGTSLDRAVVFQDYGLFPWITAGQNIILALRQKFKNKKILELKQIAIDSILSVGLEEKVYNLLPKQLSGGMKQRCAIAQTLAIDPRVLLMDEPFGALDAVTRVRLQELIKNLWQKNKKTVIFITHDVDEALKLATRIIVLGQTPSSIIYDKNVNPENDSYVDMRNELLEVINKDVNEKI